MIVPDGAELTEVRDAEQPVELFPEEEALMGAAVTKRRRDFALGRHCARESLRRLGTQPRAILRGPSREPVWPDRICGSITHCSGYWAAALAWQDRIRSIGIDAEPLKELSQDVLKLVATELELQWIREKPGGVPWDLLLFSAKESVYKAWFPIAKTWLGFEQARIEFSPRSSQFRALLDSSVQTPGGLPREIHGLYEIGRNHVFTCAFVVPSVA